MGQITQKEIDRMIAEQKCRNASHASLMEIFAEAQVNHDAILLRTALHELARRKKEEAK